MATINGVMAADVDALWWIAERWLAPAIAHAPNPIDLKQIRQAIENRDAQLWFIDGGDHGAVVTRIEITSLGKKILSAPFLGGTRMDEWLVQLDELLRAYGKHHGCCLLEGYGRKGWGRILKRLGWSVGHTGDGNLKFSRRI